MYLERWSNSNTVVDSTFSNNRFMGIYVSTSSGNVIANNSILNNAYGLSFDSSVFENTLGNNGTDNTVRNNIVMGNTVANSSLDGVYLDGCRDNIFFHNNFVDNACEVETLNSTSVWDYDAEGNYWGDYSNEDLNKDGFGDAPYAIDGNNQDNYPLMGLFSDFPFAWQEETYHVTTISNSMVSGYFFSQPDKMIGFSVGDPDKGSGFCRVGIPVSLLGGPYTLVLNGANSTSFLEKSNGTNSFLYFTYNYSSLSVKIEGTSVVPEFSPFLPLSLLAVLTVGVAVVALARKRLTPAPSGLNSSMLLSVGSGPTSFMVCFTACSTVWCSVMR
jgi:parallel beta-helix repeat protein